MNEHWIFFETFNLISLSSSMCRCYVPPALSSYRLACILDMCLSKFTNKMYVDAHTTAIQTETRSNHRDTVLRRIVQTGLCDASLGRLDAWRRFRKINRFAWRVNSLPLKYMLATCQRDNSARFCVSASVLV